MSEMTGKRLQRYGLIHAAHEFILTALPFRHRESRQALSRFVNVARGCELSIPESDAVLLTLLAVLDPHTHGRLPSLVDRYLSQRRLVPDAVARFQHCVDDVIRYRGVGSFDVQQAIAWMEARFADSRLTQAAVAEQVGASAQQLSSLFTSQTGVTFAEYLRDLRLDRAALLLVSGDASIKEIWSAVGYNDASNFCHQFRERFGTTPSEHRARAIRRVDCAPAAAPVEPARRAAQGARSSGALLVVDDNAGTCETVARHLGSAGYLVTQAGTGHAALREAERRGLDAIVLDHHLPDMTGLEFLHHLRERKREGSPAVLLFTADWDVADQAEDITGLGAMFASKLCDLDEVERLVASLLVARSAFGTPGRNGSEHPIVLGAPK